MILNGSFLIEPVTDEHQRVPMPMPTGYARAAPCILSGVLKRWFTAQRVYGRSC
jgi:hypothetical protein